MIRKLVTVDETQMRIITPYLKNDGLTFSGFIRREMVKYMREKEMIKDATDGRR